MEEINKYFNTQLTLAKERGVSRDCKKKHSVSQKSKSAAENMSKKQDKIITKNNLRIYVENNDDEYDKKYLNTIAPSQSRTKCTLKKIIDDGDRNLYKIRVANWQNSLSAAMLKRFDGSYHSADIQFILNEQGDPKETHVLQNGLRIPKFIWKQLYKYQKTGVKWLYDLHKGQSGGMLGDEMGLGKTVQIIAFLSGLFESDDGLGPSIIVAPATLVYQWVSHFHYWCPQLRIAVLHHTGSHNQNYNKLIRDINDSHGILLITYAGILKYTKNLLSKKWHYIILDEGHKIRNPNTQVSKLVKRFQTPHRLLITGSPMQNSLQELWSLFDFMRPGLLGTNNAFMEYFAVPITQGGYANATGLQKATAIEIAKALKTMITPYMLRRTKANVQKYIELPEKNEQILFCALSKEQMDLYKGYLMSGIVKSILDKEDKYKRPLRARVLVALSTLTKICNHPDLYLYEASEKFEENIEEFGNWKRSGKMTVVHSLLTLWQEQGHRTLIFSQSRAMIRILEQHLQNHEFKYLKMDGTISISQRQNLIKTFNENSDYLAFLSTTRVGGLGVNLTGADRVILYDPDWNPATDNQAKERAWRIGQRKNVTVYRLISAGTIEEKIYQRQIFKNFLNDKILNDLNQQNVFTTSSLQGLFTLEDINCNGDTETASLFKHTKVDLWNNRQTEKVHSNSSITVLKKKVGEMKKKAKEISKNISKANKNVPRVKEEVKPLESETNLLKNKETRFENVFPEINLKDIHTNKDYEKFVLKKALKQCSNHVKIEENHNETELFPIKNDKHLFVTKMNQSDQVDQRDLKEKYSSAKITLEPSKAIDKARIACKRRHSSISELHVENLLTVKRIKKNGKVSNDDDYVLSKLFAAATVKNALQHDMIGLAEKEKKHKMKELAVENANKAVDAIKLSRKQCLDCCRYLKP